MVAHDGVLGGRESSGDGVDGRSLMGFFGPEGINGRRGSLRRSQPGRRESDGGRRHGAACGGGGSERTTCLTVASCRPELGEGATHGGDDGGPDP
jgi:hypothetical protein